MIPPKQAYKAQLTLALNVDGTTLFYNGACVGMLRANTALCKRILSISFVLEKDVSITPEEKNFYLAKLAEWGFSVPSNLYNEATETWLPSYYVNCSDMNITKWFSTITVMRYLYESPKLIKWWYEKVYQDKTIDAWAMFLVAHCFDNNVISFGHSLIANRYLRTLVDPKKVLTSLVIKTGFDWTKAQNLNALWGSGGLYNKDVGIMDWEALYKHYLSLKENE